MRIILVNKKTNRQALITIAPSRHGDHTLSVTIQLPFAPNPTKWSSRANNNNNIIIPLKRNYSSYYCIKTSPKFNIKCVIMNPNSVGEKGNNLTKVGGVNGVIRRSMENVMKPVVITGVLLVLLLLYDHHQAPLALAASSSESYSTQISSPASSTSQIYTTNAQFVALMMPLTFTLVIMCYTMLRQVTPEKRCVLKLQVGLQKDPTWMGLSHKLQEVTLALLRHPNYCISGYSSVDVTRSVFECEKQFNYFSIEERSVNNIRKKSATSQGSNNEYIVVTMIVYVKGVCKLPPVKSIAQLKIALQMLASIPSRFIMNDRVFWNPQQEKECLTAQELLEDYPLLHPF